MALNDKWKVYKDPLFPSGGPPEPSVVDRIASLDDPESAVAKRVADYDKHGGSARNVLIGHKGKSFLDTGHIYAPYIPLQTTPGFDFEAPPCHEPSIIDRIGALADPECPIAKRVADYDSWAVRREEAFQKWTEERAGNSPPFLDPNDFTLRKGLRTRHVKRLVKPEHFPVVKVVDL